MTLKHTPMGLSVMNQFYDSDCIIYLEGQEDKVFWEHFFDFLEIKAKVKFKKAGDSSTIDKYIEDIVNKNAKIIVFRDMDYMHFTGCKHKHKRIVYSFGHSLENTLFSVENISKYISLLRRVPNRYKSSTETWFNLIASDLSVLQILEIASLHYNKGIEVLGDSSYRFLNSYPDNHLVNPTTVLLHRSTIEAYFTNSELKHAQSLYNKKRGKRYRYIRGHFLEGIITNYINNSSEKIKSPSRALKIHHSTLKTHLIGQMSTKTIDKAELSYLKKSFRRAIGDLGVQL